MTVETSVQLPANPPGGKTRVQALGGNGYLSPSSEMHFQLASQGDASGGANRMFIRFDTRYVQLVSSLHVFIDGASADVPVYLAVVQSDASRVSSRGVANYLPISGVPANQLSWTPQPLLVAADAAANANEPPVISITIPNVDGERATVYGHVFNFARDSRERVPVEQMLRALTRSESLI